MKELNVSMLFSAIETCARRDVLSESCDSEWLSNALSIRHGVTKTLCSQLKITVLSLQALKRAHQDYRCMNVTKEQYDPS